MEREFLKHLEFKTFVTLQDWESFLDEFGVFVKERRVARVSASDEFVVFGRMSPVKEEVKHPLTRQFSSSSQNTIFEPEMDVEMHGSLYARPISAIPLNVSPYPQPHGYMGQHGNNGYLVPPVNPHMYPHVPHVAMPYQNMMMQPRRN